MDADKFKFKELTESIIQTAFTVHNTLGSGFLEKVYENALAIELAELGLKAVQQASLQVRYEGVTCSDVFYL